MTGDTAHNQRLRVKDITALTQNFIVAKALSAFADAGVISAVRYGEDEDNLSIEGPRVDRSKQFSI
jgi:hypothetical protein